MPRQANGKISRIASRWFVQGRRRPIRSEHAGKEWPRPITSISARIGAQELTEIRRQQAEWSRQASREIARGDFQRGLDAYPREVDVTTANQDERRGEILQEPERSGEPHQSPEGGQQQEAQAERQQDAVEQALARSREQREAQGDARDATEQALVRSREERETEQQAGAAGLEATDDERSGVIQDGQANAEAAENQQERDSGPEMGD
jgi:hypothetical protein